MPRTAAMESESFAIFILIFLCKEYLALKREM